MKKEVTNATPSQTGQQYSLFSGKREQAIIAFRQFTEEDETSNDFLEDIEVKTMSDARAFQVIEKALNKRPVDVLQEMGKADRDGYCVN